MENKRRAEGECGVGGEMKIQCMYCFNQRSAHAFLLSVKSDTIRNCSDSIATASEQTNKQESDSFHGACTYTYKNYINIHRVYEMNMERSQRAKKKK